MPALGTHAAMPDWQLDRMFPDAAQAADPRPRLAQRRGHDRRGAGRVRRRSDRRHLAQAVAGAAQPAGVGRRTRPDPLDRPGRAARSHRHGQLQQEPVRRHRRGGGHQREPLHRRRLRHGADDGPGRHAPAAHPELRPGPFLPPSAAGLRADGHRPAQTTAALAVRGLFIGDDVECFQRAAALSVEVNFTVLDEPLQEGRRLSRSRGVPQHVAGQQGHLSHADGHRRRRRVDRAGPRRVAPSAKTRRSTG